MEKLTFNEWLSRTETLIMSALMEIDDRDWDENDATKSWLKAIRKASRSVELTDVGRPYAMEWDAAKLKGSPEHRYGDIGILVRINYPNGIQTEGIGFIEAKRIYPSGRYDQLETEQLQRMLKATAHHRLGIYEREPIPEAAFGLAGHGMRLFSPSGSSMMGKWDAVVAAVVPTAVALKMRGNRRSDLHPPCLPLSFQLYARYLGGYDLDFSSQIIDDAKEGGLGAPEYMLYCDVAIGGDTPPSTDTLLRVGPEGPYDAMEPEQTVVLPATELLGQESDDIEPDVIVRHEQNV
jgi:hypothetical protein